MVALVVEAMARSEIDRRKTWIMILRIDVRKGFEDQYGNTSAAAVVEE